jgi:hypothetical protein
MAWSRGNRAIRRWSVVKKAALTLATTIGFLGVVVVVTATSVPGVATGDIAELPPTVGPRGTVGPDVPLSEAEKTAFQRRVSVEERTTAGIQAACDRAVTEGIPVVFLPAGEYIINNTVRVSGGLTLLGEGSKTLCQEKFRSMPTGYVMFRAQGDRIRFTRLKLRGSDPPLGRDFNNTGILASGQRNVWVDHCELTLLARATEFSDEATGQVSHCFLHDNLTAGLGYGVNVISGSYVLVQDNEFSHCRHSLASNGGGTRKSHWEFVHNRVLRDDRVASRQSAVDTHGGMDGTFVVEGNHFEGLQRAIGILDGSGLIWGNLFQEITIAISISAGSQDGRSGLPHEIQVAGNSFLDPVAVRYEVGKARNVSINGLLVPETREDGSGGPTPIPWLQEMDEEGILHWNEARPVALGNGSVGGRVIDEKGQPIAGATIMVGETTVDTDAEGQFSLTAVSEAVRFLVASRSGFQRALVGLRVHRDQHSILTVPLSRDRTE